VDDDDAPDAPAPAPDEDDRFVTLARCGTAATADFIRSLLENAGIESVLQDQYLSRVFAFLTGPIGGVRVQVRRRDLPAALEVLRHPPVPLAAGNGSDEAEDAAAAGMPGPQCQECGSTVVSFEPAEPEGFLIAWIERVLPLPFLHGHWVCGACGKRWLEVTAPRA
jgi:hypothetical protein